MLPHVTSLTLSQSPHHLRPPPPHIYPHRTAAWENVLGRPTQYWATEETTSGTHKKEKVKTKEKTQREEEEEGGWRGRRK